jgi:hypothetical protein
VRSNRHIIINVLFMLFEIRIFVLDISIRDVINRLKVINSDVIGSFIFIIDNMFVDGYRDNIDKKVNMDNVLHSHHHFLDLLNISDCEIKMIINIFIFSICLVSEILIYQCR